MSLLSYYQLTDLVRNGVITDVVPESINGASIDVHLGATIVVEDESDRPVDLAKREKFASRSISIVGAPYRLEPGEFVLAHTREMFYLPDDIVAEFRLKSSGARSGLENSFACYCDPRWHGSALTLELKNQLRHHPLILTAGMPIGQMLFYRVEPVPEDRSYAVRGRYNGDAGVSEIKA